MKHLKQIFSAVLVVAMLLSAMSLCVGAASTPAAQTIEALPGETVTIRLCESDCYGISGDITYDNRDLFSSLTPGTSPYGQIRENSFILSSADKVECEVVLTAKISDKAAVGSKCVITFADYLRVENNSTLEGPEGLQKTVTVQVVEKQSPTTQGSNGGTQGTQGGEGTGSTGSAATTTVKGDDGTDSTGSAAATTTKGDGTDSTGSAAATTTKGDGTDSTGSAATTTTVKDPAAEGKVDLTELNKQIGIAEALKSEDYTEITWAKLKSALEKARAARQETSQAAIDKAAKNLKDAIAGLLRVDKKQLQDLLDKLEEMIANDEIAALWEELLEAYEKAKAALKSGNSAEISEALEALQAAFEAYNAKLAELGKSEIVYVDKPVEVMPTDPFCNIWVHKLWPILLIVSVILNLGFIGLIVYYFVRRKKNLTDDTPMVSYDIDDDTPIE